MELGGIKTYLFVPLDFFDHFQPPQWQTDPDKFGLQNPACARRPALTWELR
jgi:hypothetical protein